MPRLLVLACSDKKRPDAGLLPAIERYDGPAFRVLRKFVRENGSDELRVLILSAKFGLIDAKKRIPNYDQRLTPSQAKWLRKPTLRRLRFIVRSQQPHSLALSVGRLYAGALEGFDSDLPRLVVARVLRGGLGPRLTALKQWLHEADRPETILK